MTRSKRTERLGKIIEQQDLSYWVTLYVEAEIAGSRWELLRVLDASVRSPELARQLAVEAQDRMLERHDRFEELVTNLEELSDPESRTRLDWIRQRSRRQLRRQQEVVANLKKASSGFVLHQPTVVPGTEVIEVSERRLGLPALTEGSPLASETALASIHRSTLGFRPGSAVK